MFVRSFWQLLLLRRRFATALSLLPLSLSGMEVTLAEFIAHPRLWLDVRQPKQRREASNGITFTDSGVFCYVVRLYVPLPVKGRLDSFLISRETWSLVNLFQTLVCI